MKRNLLVLIFLVFFIQDLGYSQNNFQLSGQFRYRLEILDKSLDKDTKYSDYSLLRSRISLNFTPIRNVRTFFQLQDSRTMGEETGTIDGSADMFDLHQGYLQIDSVFQSSLSVKLGRFESVLGNQRLIGAVGWSNVGRSFDGINLNYIFNYGRVDVFSYKINELGKNGNEGDLDFSGIWTNLNLISNLNSDVFALWRLENGAKNLDEKTFGTNLNFKSGGFNTSIETVYQTGRLDTTRDISAYLIALNANYTIAENSIRPTLLAGIDYLSGDDNPYDGDYTVFNTLYATNHKFYGIMDYFLNIPENTNGLGLTDLQLGFSANLCEKLNAIVKFHRFLSSKKFTLSDNKKTDSFGDEVDIVLNHKYNSNIDFQLGGGLFFPGKIYKTIKGDEMGSFLYLSVLAML